MDRQAEEDATDELVALLLDELGPALQWYRNEVARRIGLSPSEMLCVEICRRRGPISSGRLGEQLGMTRSAVAKLVRRLEARGHVAREAGRHHEQEIHVRLVPHARRDAVLEDLRTSLHGSVLRVVAAHAVRGRRHSLVAGVVVGLTDIVFTHARALAEAVTWRCILAERRAARADLDARPWWTRY
ncbi:MarR family transcriptional regulator [Actinomycetospora sp. NBRC 106375]|uniref:MarR family winged helix-turn-helix transcriptional regulator n=1 Tax=Actinomycetospora sp. NBRC 106375 TaxID=3032207 RepID=UPI002553AEB0|nr:MarR family transcriptional regulator [Actinomycetospora sp. NBRC 106375]